METENKVYAKYLNQARDLCSRQEKCISDIIRKLETWGCPSHFVPKLVKELVAGKYIDEVRFATSFAHTKFRQNKWGKNKISFALKSKKIPEEIIQNTLKEAIPEEEYKQTLIQLLQNKLNRLGNRTSYELLGKLINLGSAKGFEYDLVNKTARDLIKK